MKRSILLFLAVLLCLSLCGMTEFAAPLPVPPASPAPSSTAEPSPSPSPEPSPSPAPRVPREISGEGSIFDLLQAGSTHVEIDMAEYYLEQMAQAAASGDRKAGLEAQQYRDELIDLGSAGEKISYEELSLLARIICAEADSDWLSQDFRLCVGEVVLNRVASPEFPDTLEEVVYQKNQFAGASAPGFAGLVPGRACVDAALRLLQGERKMAPSVVFLSGYEQGEIFSIHKDRRLGTTYFCISPNLELYP